MASKEGSRSSEGDGHDLSVTLPAQVLIGLVVDIIRDELHASVTEQELRAARMRRFEADFGVPIAWAMARVGRGLITRIEIDRDERRAVTIAIIGGDPAILDVLRARGPHLPEE